MADTDLDKALFHLEKVAETSQIQAIKLELRFLRTFVKYTASRCDQYQNLQDLLNRIRDVGRRAQKLHKLSPSSREQQAGESEDLAAHVLNKIKFIKPKVRQVHMLMVSKTPISVTNSSLRSQHERNEFFYEFIDSLQMDVKLLINSKADLVLYVEKIKILPRKLRFLGTFLKLLAIGCAGHEKHNELFTHFQAIADTAACVSFFCLVDKIDENLKHILVFHLSNLLCKIEPVTPEVRELYIGVLRASRPISYEPYYMSFHYVTIEFIDSLFEDTMELLKDNTSLIIPIKDHIEILQIALIFVKYMLDLEKYSCWEPYVEMVLEAGCSLYSFYKKEVKQAATEEMKLARSELLEKFKSLRAWARNPNLKVPKPWPSNFPRTGKLGFLDSFLGNLKELLNNKPKPVAFWKHHIKMIQGDLELLRSFLTKISEKRNEQLEDIWGRIIRVAYEAEYAIDLVMLRNLPLLHHLLWVSDVIEKIKLIKTEISSIQIFVKNDDDDIKDLEVAKDPIHSRTTTNSPRMDEGMVGFKDEKEKIIEQLVSGPEQLDIVAIVGMPGLGKTLLAQKIYDNPTVKGQFHVCAWSCVSLVYEKKELLINILSQIKETTAELSKMTDEDLAGELKRGLLGQKYLVILDDVWDTKPWDALRRSFPQNKFGSRIVFTSRFHDLASKVKRDSKVHHLRLFSHDESWELLSKKLFGKDSFPLELQEVGKQIAKNCKGLPLAVVVVAGILARMKKTHQWKEVADSLSSYLVNDPEGHCNAILELSYNNLPDYLKPCFLYFGAFPEDKVIPSWKLIRLWMAEGFVPKTEPNSLENTAEDYLMDLIGRSLITVTKRRSTGGVKACSVHDLVRDFCLDKAKKENFLHLIDTSSNLSAMRSSKHTGYKQRRLCMHFKQRDSSWSTSSGPLVRSLLFFAPREVDSFRLSDVSSICRGFKLLRVLDLMCFNLAGNLPSAIDSLAHLRYLAICGAIDHISPSVANLRNLETFLLKILCGDRGVNLPHTISNLAKLRHLHISNWFIFSRQGNLSGLLDNLQTISTPIIAYGGDMEEKMKSFPNVKKLSCIFRESWDSYMECNRLPILDFLRELESLKVSYSGKMRYPCEFSFPSNIKKLTMSHFRLPWKKISVIWKLPNLEVLKLLSEAFEGQEWEMEDETFPKLKFMKLEGLNITRWTASGDSDDHFPFLERLVLQRCRQLEEIPSCLGGSSTLKMIKVQWCSISIVKSIQQILDEQKDWGNEELKVGIRRLE